MAAPAPDDAEQVRLSAELETLAQRNSWTGVERVYGSLLALGGELPPDTHLLGAAAARSRGDAGLVWVRLGRVPAPAGNAAPAAAAAWAIAQEERRMLLERFRFVSVQVDPSVAPVLTRSDMPFAQLERDSVALAQGELAAHACWRGLLPIGDYRVGDTAFRVEPGSGWMAVAVGFDPPR